MENNSRTHEPNLRELTGQLDELEKLLNAKFDALKDLIDERDRRYEDRFTAMDEKTSLALTSSKEAVAKAEAATEKRFDSVNEFRKTLSDQATNFLPRPEYVSNHQSLLDKIDGIKENLSKEISGIRDSSAREIASLREARSGSEAKSSLLSGNWGPINIIVTLLAVVGFLMLFWRSPK
jgi:hypothetical protein